MRTLYCWNCGDLFNYEFSHLPDVLLMTGMVKSKGETRRLIKQGGIKIDGEKVTSVNIYLAWGFIYLVQIGKKRFIRINMEN